jgi:hypothetical protein
MPATFNTTVSATMPNFKLTIELVPRTSWYDNVRSQVTPAEWDRLRKACYRQAGYCCQVCGGKGTQWPVECHEIWEYNTPERVQKLTGLIALCPPCHRVKHPGKAQIDGKLEEVYTQLQRVNNMNRAQATAYLTDAMTLWAARSRHQWKVDVSLLETL